MHLEELGAGVARDGSGAQLSHDGCWVILYPPLQREMGQEHLIFALPGCSRMVLKAEHCPQLTLAFASVGLCSGPLLPQLSEGWGMCAFQTPSFCSLGNQNFKSEAHGCEAVVPREQSPRMRGCRLPLLLSCSLVAAQKVTLCPWSC